MSVSKTPRLKETLPTMYDLPSEAPEEPGLPDEYHLWQSQLCTATFCPANYPPEEVFVASDLNLYYDPEHTRWYKRPDWYAVVGIPRLYENRTLRLSYVMWQEEVKPLVVIELLSPSTRDDDLGKSRRKGEQPTKWQVYEQIVGIPYYIVFDGYSDELRAFQLRGERYHQMALTEAKVWIPSLEIGLGLWQGNYRGERQWLRWYDADGNWIPTPEERAEGERLRAEGERLRAEGERLRAEGERQAKESAQLVAEQERLRAEGERQAKESAQLVAEQERLRAEGERQAKESAQLMAAQERLRAEDLARRLREAGIDLE
jgi:Uma2 family endonuclease